MFYCRYQGVDSNSFMRWLSAALIDPLNGGYLAAFDEVMILRP
jgi:hypothetical protein